MSGVSNSDTYTITAQSNATGAVSGGGTSVGFIPNELSSIVDSVATSVSAAYYDTSTFLAKISEAASAIASATLSDAL